MQMSEAVEGITVTHQFGHGRSFEGHATTTGKIVSTEGMKAWRQMVQVEIAETGEISSCWLEDLTVA